MGSRPYPFDRLFRELDRIIEEGLVHEEVFAQTGASTYVPRHFPYQAFLSPDEFSEKMGQADIVISHGASGSIMGALSRGKKVIAVARLARHGEHINDHQVGINESFSDEGLVLNVPDLSDLGQAVADMEAGNVSLRPWHNESPQAIPQTIDAFIQEQLLGVRRHGTEGAKATVDREVFS
ncbi:MAG: glycosyltransferase [Acidobacteriota bacterium]|nr:glycosyltransferase [Acidobacteriota bacterium]